jgi:hypothetical protein
VVLVAKDLYALAVAEPDIVWLALLAPGRSPGKVRLMESEIERHPGSFHALRTYLDSL